MVVKIRLMLFGVIVVCAMSHGAVAAGDLSVGQPLGEQRHYRLLVGL